MLEKERLESKRISKTDAVVSQVNHEVAPKNVYIGPSDYVPFLEDRKWCYLYIEGTEFGDIPVRAEVKLEVWDSPNSAGVAIDAIRCCKIARDRGISGALYGPSALFHEIATASVCRCRSLGDGWKILSVVGKQSSQLLVDKSMGKHSKFCFPHFIVLFW